VLKLFKDIASSLVLKIAVIFITLFALLFVLGQLSLPHGTFLALAAGLFFAAFLVIAGIIKQID